MVVDASIWVSALVPHDLHHVASLAWLTQQWRGGGDLVAPTLLLPEVGGAVGDAPDPQGMGNSLSPGYSQRRVCDSFLSTDRWQSRLRQQRRPLRSAVPMPSTWPSPVASSFRLSHGIRKSTPDVRVSSRSSTHDR